MRRTRKPKSLVGIARNSLPASEIFRDLAIKNKNQIADTTKHFEKWFPATKLSRWMDVSSTGAGYGGRYHRVVHGHDLATNFTKVAGKFGIKTAVTDFPFEILKDASTIDGVPYPGVQKLVNKKFITPLAGGTWGSMSFAKAIPGGLALYGTYCLRSAAHNKELRRPSAAVFATIGIVTKIVGGVLTQNPVLLISGLGDFVILVRSKNQLNIALRQIRRIVKNSARKIYGLASITVRRFLDLLREVRKVAKKSRERITGALSSIYRRVKLWSRAVFYYRPSSSYA